MASQFSISNYNQFLLLIVHSVIICISFVNVKWSEDSLANEELKNQNTEVVYKVHSEDTRMK